MKRSSQGGLLMTVMISVALVGLIAGSVASLISFQRKSGIRQQLKLHSMNAAEAAIDYAYAYITNDANLNGLENSAYIPASGADPKLFEFPEDALSFLRNKNAMPTSAKGGDSIDFTDIKVSVMPRPASQARIFKDPKTTPDTDPTRGQWVYQETITLVAAVTGKQGGITQTSYARKDINYNITNLFQHSIFYQGQLHLHRGFKVMGPTHTNGNLILNAHDGDKAIYNGNVTAGGRYYRGTLVDSGGTGMDGYGLVKQNADGDLIDFETKQGGNGSGITSTPGSGDIPIYYDSPTIGADAGKHLYRFAHKDFDSRTAGWKDTADSDFNGHLKDKSHGIPNINPIGSLGYIQDVEKTEKVNEFSNGPYFLIEPLLPPDNALRKGDTSTKTNYRYNLSASASLVLRVEYAARDAAGNYVPNPNITKTYCPNSNYTVGVNALPQSENPANYIVRAYKKNLTRDEKAVTRANDPEKDRTAIPFPTDVIGRADYQRAESGLVAQMGSTSSFKYVDGANPMAIDVIGTEKGITTAASPLNTNELNSNETAAEHTTRATNEAWHRYRIETYYPVASLQPIPAAAALTNITAAAGTALKPFYSTKFNDILQWSYIVKATSGGKTTYTTYTKNRIGTPAAPRDTPAAIASTATIAYPLYGTHDSRLGRGVHLLTLDIGRLKAIMEEPIANVEAKFGAEAKAFRDNFNNGAAEWNGIVYVEFPTTTTVVYNTTNPDDSVNRAPSTSKYYDNATTPETPGITPTPDKSYLDTFLFEYASTAEKRHPLRIAEIADTTSKKVDRTDNIVPIAKEFRRYPSTHDITNLTDPANAILALQVVNAKQLPKVNITKVDANAGNALNSGFTLATNGPIYLIGSWNSDGDYTTGAKIDKTAPTEYATVDSGSIDDANTEIPSAIFCDTLTILSPGWGTQTNYTNQSSTGLTRRQFSYPGLSGNSDTYRYVTFKNDNERIEISACISTGEYPIFEFFTHALESFIKYKDAACTPLVVKGSMVGMFTSEIQHIKQAYGRPVADDAQDSWNGHGAHCFPSPRMHKFVVDGNFPPGTPQALVPAQSNFQIIFKNDELVQKAGF